MTLSARCETRLAGVHPDLVRVVQNLAAGGAVFRVVEGVRTMERQRDLVAAGASQTMNSRHITGHAVDLVPMIDGAVSWDWNHFYPMADAFRAATIAEKVPVIWGGAWGLLMSDYTTAKAGQDRYKARMKTLNVRPFLDGPHFELERAFYP